MDYFSSAILARTAPTGTIIGVMRYWRKLPLLALLLSAILLTAGCDAAGGSSEPSVLFLHPGPNGATQLFIHAPGTHTARQLTGGDDPRAPQIIDYAPSPDGRRIVYTAADGAGGSTIRRVDADGSDSTPLAACPQAECAGPVWSPDGRRIIYESRPLQGGLLASPRLFWLDPDTGETLPLVEGNETPGYGARFSPDGRWLSYVSLADEGLVLYNLQDGQQRLLSSRVGSPAAWSPDSTAVVYGDLVVQGDQTAPDVGGGALPVQESSTVYLFRSIAGGDGSRERLSPDAGVADSAPAYSPDGQWIAFGRTPANTAAARQLWIMRPDGSEARALTSDPAVTHGPPSWSANGRSLLFQRYHIADAAGVTSVWTLDVATGEETLVADGGYLPAWRP